MELLTPKQEARRKRDIAVAKTYVAMRGMYPNASPSRIITRMAMDKCQGLTSEAGIRSAILRVGTI